MNRRLPPHRFYQALRAGLQHGIRRAAPARPDEPPPAMNGTPDGAPEPAPCPTAPLATYSASGLPPGLMINGSAGLITGWVGPATDASGKVRAEFVPLDPDKPQRFSGQLPPGVSPG